MVLSDWSLMRMPTSVRMVPYQSEEAKQALGESYQPGRPNAAFLVHP